MRWRGWAAAGLLLGLLLAGEGHAQDQAALRAFEALNESAVATYRDAKRRFLAATEPVVIVGFDAVLIRQRGKVRRCGEIPPGYHVMKAVGHVPRSVWAALRPAVEGHDPGQAWRARLAELRDHAEAALGVLPRAGLSPAAAERDAGLLRASIGLIDRYLVQGPPSRTELQTAARALAPAILADAAEAARLQLEALDADVRPWWAGLSEAERAATHVVVLGPKAPRADNLAYGYFVNLLGRGEAEHRVVYAEGVFDPEGADALLAGLVTDRRLSTDFFADERRMERDLLADGAEAHLLEMFGRLGTP
jgi:hypothetical protein